MRRKTEDTVPESSGRRGKAARRHERLLQILTEADGAPIRNSRLSEELGVSIATLRRDVAQLQAAGRIVRTYGGVSVAPTRTALSMGERERSHSDEKRAIAEAAVGMLSDGDLVILDAGSTAEQLAVQIGYQLELTVVTNGIRAINRLVTQDRVQVMVLGGYLRGSNGTICGGEAESMIERVRGDIAFVGAVRVSPRRGIASLTYDQARLKSLMMQHSREVVVLADSSKFSGNDDYPYWSPMPSHWTLITDVGADPAHLEALRQQGADSVIQVDPVTA